VLFEVEEAFLLGEEGLKMAGHVRAHQENHLHKEMLDTSKFLALDAEV
jgi:hypothetical protein